MEFYSVSGNKIIPGIFYEFIPSYETECVVDGGGNWVIRTFRFAQCLEKMSHLKARLFIGKPVDEDNSYWFFVEESGEHSIKMIASPYL